MGDSLEPALRMVRSIAPLPLLALLATQVFSAPHPLPQGGDYLTIKISREDQGVKSSFDSAVSKAEQKLQVSGPPAPLIDFPGTLSTSQAAHPHVPPFLAFSKFPSLDQHKK